MRARAASILGQLRVPCILRCDICSPHPAPRATAIDSSIASSKRSSSLRMCVAYTSLRDPSGRHNAISSASGANAPGVYSSPDEAPHAPSATARSTMRVMRSSSSGVATRSVSPTTAPRTLPSPIMAATFTAGLRAFIVAAHDANDRSGLPTNRELPSAPATIVVTPCRTTDSARGSAESELSPCEWMSMKPGATASPRASISTVPFARMRGATDTMRPALTATSATRPAVPVPSNTMPPRMIRSCAARCTARAWGRRAPATATVAVTTKSRRVVMAGQSWCTWYRISNVRCDHDARQRLTPVDARAPMRVRIDWLRRGPQRTIGELGAACSWWPFTQTPVARRRPTRRAGHRTADSRRRVPTHSRTRP